MEPELLAVLRPCSDKRLKIWPVDNKVGNVRNTGASTKPDEIDSEQLKQLAIIVTDHTTWR
jgi:putative SOS response-associated peptidase YedK